MKRLVTFLIHLFFYLPLSFIINLAAILPIGLFFMGDQFEIIFILAAIAGPALAFALSKLRLRIKGKRTDTYYEVAYTKLNCLVSHEGLYTRETWWAEDSTSIESENTAWGWLGILLSFVAFPLQVIATVASLLAMVFPIIYSTTNRLPNEEDFSVLNRTLYVLFDFVIIPIEYERVGRSSALGILFVPLYIISVFCGVVLSGFGLNYLIRRLDFIKINIDLGILSLFLLVLAAAAVIVTVVDLIKGIVFAVADFDIDSAFLRALKLFGLACASGALICLLEFV